MKEESYIISVTELKKLLKQYRWQGIWLGLPTGSLLNALVTATLDWLSK